MSATIAAVILAASAIAAVHILSPKLRFLDSVPRRAWLSAAGGVALAYVFVHLLPELADLQVTALSDQERLMRRERELFLLALVGLLSFYGLEKLASRAQGDAASAGSETPLGVFWVHIGGFAIYNALIGYLLVHRDHGGMAGLVAFAFAMAVHFLVNDRAFNRHHGRRYLAAGRWLLAGAVYLGLAVGLATSVSELVVSLLFAFLAGAIILNVMKEELPEERDSAFSALIAGAAAYGSLLAFV